MGSVIKKINEFNAGTPPTLKELKWNAMKESPFRFFRGTCHLFANDFYRLYHAKPKVKSWICGDMHFENFGSYKGENRIVYFDLNDFDEAILASPEAEICRFLTSIQIAATQMKTAAISLHKTVHDVMATYTTTLEQGKALMLEAEVAHGVFKKYFERLSLLDRATFIEKHTYKQKGALMLKIDHIHTLALDDATKTKIYHSVKPLLSKDKFDHLVFEDAAFRIAGTGSLGLQRYCLLCFNKKRGKHYLIDVKEARKSCYTGLVKIKQPRFKNEAERVNAIGNMMQFNSPAFLSTVSIDKKWFMVREMQPADDKMTVASIDNDFSQLSAVAKEMAKLIAYAQIRSSGHMGSSTADELIDYASKKQWQKDIIDLSSILAKKNAKYYKDFVQEG